MNNLRCVLKSSFGSVKSNFFFNLRQPTNVNSFFTFNSIATQRSIVFYNLKFIRNFSVQYFNFNKTLNKKFLTSNKNSFLNINQFSTMAPISTNKSNIDKLINDNRVLIFSKSFCPFCDKVKKLFDNLGVTYNAIELDQIDNGDDLHSELKEKISRTSVPQVFINNQWVGGCDDTHEAEETGKLKQLLESNNYDYDLIVIGGGSGGLAASKEAAKLGKKVALLDFVTPSHQGTTWGLGGTCVNVGCIPKKLMHQAALVGMAIKYSQKFGWESKNGECLKDVMSHNWSKMVEEVQANIKSSNFKYRVALRNEKVKYINAYGSFEDKNKIKTVDNRNNVKYLTSKDFLIATGERPKLPDDCEGVELGITSDDLFSLPNSPGKTIVVGASYVALECAGFLKGLNLDVTVMVRSILLRGFDQEFAEKIGEHMAEEGIRFLRPCVPKKIELISESPKVLRVTSVNADGQEIVEECETVVFAIGRKPCTDKIGLENVGVELNKNGKVITNNETTNVPNIYAVGDIIQNRPELTPVAIQSGILLVNRLYNNSNLNFDAMNIPTTLFTPMEYGCVGLSEEEAVKKYGEENLEVYIQNSTPFEWGIAHHLDNKVYSKLICLKNENERVIGFHFLGPNAGEVTQLAALALKKNATKFDFDNTVGIHPTCAEIFTNMKITRRSGISPMQALCCG